MKKQKQKSNKKKTANQKKQPQTSAEHHLESGTHDDTLQQYHIKAARQKAAHLHSIPSALNSLEQVARGALPGLLLQLQQKTEAQTTSRSSKESTLAVEAAKEEAHVLNTQAWVQRAFACLSLLKYVLHRLHTTAQKQTLQLQSCIEWGITESLSYDEISRQYGDAGGEGESSGFFTSTSQYGHKTPSLLSQHTMEEKWNQHNDAVKNNSRAGGGDQDTYTDLQMHMLSTLHDSRDYGAGPCTASGGDGIHGIHGIHSSGGTCARRMERLLVQQLSRLCCVFTTLSDEVLSASVCKILTPPLKAIFRHTTSSATRRDVASAVALLASRTEPKPLRVLMNSGLPQLIFEEAVSIQQYGRAQKTSRPHVDRDTFLQCLLALCALAAQESVKTSFLQLRCGSSSSEVYSPLVFFCHICLANGKTRDAHVEKLAALGIGALLDDSHHLITISSDTDSNKAESASFSSSTSSSASTSAMKRSNPQHQKIDVEGLVRVALVQSQSSGGSNESNNVEINSSDNKTNSISEDSVVNYEFRADILSKVVAATMMHSSSSTSHSSDNAGGGSFVTWISLAAVANLFSIFEVRNHLLENASLKVLLSLTRLLTKSTTFEHGSGVVTLCSQLEVVKALCTATKTPSGIQCWLKFESDALLFQDSAGVCTPRPFKCGRPLHVLTDEKTIFQSLEHVYKEQCCVNEVTWTHKEEEDLMRRLRNSKECWGCQFQCGDVIDLGSTDSDISSSSNNSNDSNDHGNDDDDNSGIAMTRRWTLSVWCRGGEWVRKGCSTLMQSTNGDKMVCLDEMGRLGTMKAALASEDYEDLFARWYCVRYPDPERPAYTQVYTNNSNIDSDFDGDIEDSEDSRTTAIASSGGDDSSDDDNNQRAPGSLTTNTSQSVYANQQEHLMDDPHRWFHLVVIANPVPTATNQDSDTNTKKQKNKKNKKNKNVNENAQTSNNNTNNNKKEKTAENTELRFYIDGLPIRTTVTTRRPMGRIRTVGNSFEGDEPWGAIADFRLYSRSFSHNGKGSWPQELLIPPPTFPVVPRPFPMLSGSGGSSGSSGSGQGGRSTMASSGRRFVDVDAIDDVRQWLVRRGVLHSIVALLGTGNRNNQSQLLERACATLANIALYPPSIPFLLQQTVSVVTAQDTERGWRNRVDLKHLREEEETLLAEEIRLRERIVSREKNRVTAVDDGSSGPQDEGDSSNQELEGDILLLMEFDQRREDVLARISDLLFEEEYRISSRRVSLPRVLATLTGMNELPSRATSVRMQAQRLMINLR